MHLFAILFHFILIYTRDDFLQLKVINLSNLIWYGLFDTLFSGYYL